MILYHFKSTRTLSGTSALSTFMSWQRKYPFLAVHSGDTESRWRMEDKQVFTLNWWDNHDLVFFNCPEFVDLNTLGERIRERFNGVLDVNQDNLTTLFEDAIQLVGGIELHVTVEPVTFDSLPHTLVDTDTRIAGERLAEPQWIPEKRQWLKVTAKHIYTRKGHDFVCIHSTPNKVELGAFTARNYPVFQNDIKENFLDKRSWWGVDRPEAPEIAGFTIIEEFTEGHQIIRSVCLESHFGEILGKPRFELGVLRYNTECGSEDLILSSEFLGYIQAACAKPEYKDDLPKQVMQCMTFVRGLVLRASEHYGHIRQLK